MNDKPEIESMRVGEVLGIPITDASSDWYMKFYPDGHVEINPRFTNDEAAKGFWDAVETMRPPWAKGTVWVCFHEDCEGCSRPEKVVSTKAAAEAWRAEAPSFRDYDELDIEG